MPDPFSMDIPSMVVGTLFSIVGMGAFGYGKKTGGIKAMILGVALMLYPWFTNGILLTSILGIVLTALLFIWKDE